MQVNTTQIKIMINEIKILNKKQQSLIKGFGPVSGGAGNEPESECTGDLDGNPNTTWDKYCKEGETEN